MIEYWLWFADRQGLNGKLRRELMEHFGSPEKIYRALERNYAQFNLSQEALASLKDKTLAGEQKIMWECCNTNIQIITIQDAAYPDRLRNIYDPPMVLYYRGKIPKLDQVAAIGVVGTRHPSLYGERMARQLGGEITACGGVVVSGAAAGIDSAAMSAALDAGGPVVGVLGCGVDVVYPKSSQGLYQKIVEQGCLLSEYAPGTPPLGWNFPKRNRIISGLSCGVVVVEAPEKSGSLITARYANEQGRDVYAVPGNAGVSGFVGSNKLLREGAGAVCCGWDVMSEYQSRYAGIENRPCLPKSTAPKADVSPEVKPEPQKNKPVEHEIEPVRAGHTDIQQETQQSRPADPRPAKKRAPRKPAPPIYPKRKELETELVSTRTDEAFLEFQEKKKRLSKPEQALIVAIGEGEPVVDDVIARSHMDVGQVLALLTMLELKHLVVRIPGRRIALNIAKNN